MTIIRSLLAHPGADPHRAAPSSPLHLACRADSEEVVDLLLERGVNPDPVRVDGVSPLHLAVIGNNLNIARKLLDRGVCMCVCGV